ncbi:NUDIX domain-containing protein [Nocardioides sp. B-3]|uniref:NUDIX domain-containing protein n=1 Tax=Nocardioides sp. B-3 TaxID=2895565 RepID=UPI002152F200|nr:NUDIX domain-containing protein [Nocardioides sp. B-3]UUZ59212.1 NUDIX domain-containing protein [Nocardioides sp. B-3]
MPSSRPAAGTSDDAAARTTDPSDVPRNVRRRGRRDMGAAGWPPRTGETLEQAARRELLEETGLTAGDLWPIDVYSGPEFVVRYPDGYAAYVVGATFETSAVTGDLTTDVAGETVAPAWFAPESLPAEINDYNRLLLRRAGLDT